MEEKEKEILESCAVLMFRYGIRSLTMDEISRNLGISKKTLYQYFENKADLIEKLLSVSINKQKQCFEYFRQGNKNPIQEMASIYKHNSVMFKNMNPSLIFELQKYYPKAWQIFDTFRSEFVLNSVADNLQRGVDTGLYRKDIDINIISRLYTFRITDVILGEVLPIGDYTHDQLMREMFYYHIRGIASRKGLDYLENEINLDE